MNIRLRMVRNHFSKTQKEFGGILGVSRDTYASYESGRVIPNATFIQLLCNTFGINQNWLVNGVGEMFNPSAKNIVSQLVSEYELDELDEAIITSYLSLGTAERNVVKNYIKAIVNKIDNSSSRNELIANDIAATELAIEELVNKNAK